MVGDEEQLIEGHDVDASGEAEVVAAVEGDWGRLHQRNILADRLANNRTPDILYHYCSPETLIAILSKSTLRFSDLTKLNDEEETVWGYEAVFKECLSRIIKGRGVPTFVPSLSERNARYLTKAG